MLQHQVTGLDLPDFDLTRQDCSKAIADAGAEIVIHAGAHTDGMARNVPWLAMASTPTALSVSSRAAAQAGARLIWRLDRLRFDGTGTRPYLETDSTNPASAYGASKCAGEQRALSRCENTLVVRTVWLYGRRGRIS